MTRISANRLVTARACGLPLTLLNRIGKLPSKCFCRPVISRSGFTSLSVSIRSPSARSHSSVERRLVTSLIMLPAVVLVATSFMASPSGPVVCEREKVHNVDRRGLLLRWLGGGGCVLRGALLF